MKYLKILISFILIFSVTGCFNVGLSSNTGGKGEGKIYNIVSLKDNGVNMFYGIVPSGWKGSISSVNQVNSTHPFVETVVLTSPDNSAKITILSQNSYTDNSKFKEGENKDYYTTYLHFMDASGYLDYYMKNTYGIKSSSKDGTVDSVLVDDFKELHKLKLSLAKEDAKKLGAENYGVKISIGDEGVSFNKKEYESGLNYFEASTGVSAISTNLKSSLSSLLDSKATVWYMPYLIVYSGDTKEDFDKYYKDYEFIVANSNFTKDYYQMVEYVSSSIVNAYTSYYAAKSKAALDATNSYIDSNYTSTSSSDTNDRVMQMWDDVIKEVDTYTLEDGSTIKTDYSVDTVAQNGNEIYMGSKAGIPIGFDELPRN